MKVMRAAKDRRHLSAGCLRQIRLAVEREAEHFDVSMSFVVNTALAHALGVKLDSEDDYRKSIRRTHAK